MLTIFRTTLSQYKIYSATTTSIAPIERIVTMPKSHRQTTTLIAEQTPHGTYNMMKVGFKARWQKRWYSQEPGLREQYDNDPRKFFKAYYRDGDTIIRYQEYGVEAFARLILAQERIIYAQAAKDAVAMMINALSTEEGNLAKLDFDFLSVDFEGSVPVGKSKGVKSFGVAKLDSRNLAKPVGSSNLVVCSNYYTPAAGRTGFLFGPNYQVSSDELRMKVRQTLNNYDPATSCARKVILVGHSIWSDVKTMEELGISIQDYPNVVGVIDTLSLAWETLGQGPSVGRALLLMNIPFIESSLHCAGNDAYYTMQLLAALLHTQYKSSPDSSLDLLARLSAIAQNRMPLERTQEVSEEQEAKKLDALMETGLLDIDI